jgi:hypothetical protein
MAQTKADRSAAAKKAAVTRERNRERAEAGVQGKKSAASRQAGEARDSVTQAKTAAGKAASSVVSAAKHAGDAARSAGKAVASQAGAAGRKGSR